MIIGVSGKFQSGKDTVARMIAEYYKSLGLTVYRVAFADAVKAVVEIVSGETRVIVDQYSYSTPVIDFNIDQKNKFLPEWNMTLGEMLQKVGTDAMRNHFDKDVWIKSTFNKINFDDIIYIISDVRFINEADRIKERGGKIIRVEGDPLKIRSSVKRNIKHESETSLDNYKQFDIILDNNNTLEILKKSVHFYLDHLIAKNKK